MPVTKSPSSRVISTVSQSVASHNIELGTQSKTVENSTKTARSATDVLHIRTSETLNPLIDLTDNSLPVSSNSINNTKENDNAANWRKTFRAKKKDMET